MAQVDGELRAAEQRHARRYNRPLTYVLDGHTPVPCNILQFGVFMEQQNRQVAHEHVGPYLISTVFLGVDHAFGGGPPILFETMTFSEHAPQISFDGGTIKTSVQSPLLNDAYPDLGICRRYATWEQAEAGHREVVKLVERFQETGVMPEEA